MCADALLEHEEEFAPFCELTDEITSFEAYVESVRSSSNWGGHLELRALSVALQRPVHVYSVNNNGGGGSGNDSSEPLVIDAAAVVSSQSTSASASVEPIRLSYHLHYYSLGEHYNTVVSVPHDEY